MKRLREEEQDEPAKQVAGDYFVVSARSCSWVVSTEMARFIEACLDKRLGIKWLKFVDLHGSRVRLASRYVEYIHQSTTEARAADRRFQRELRQEQKQDRNWDEDEC